MKRPTDEKAFDNLKLSMVVNRPKPAPIKNRQGSDVEAIKKAINLREFAEKYTRLRGRGPKYMGLCPLHQEKNPSFMVDEDKQLFHCFGCNQGGDLISFVMQAEKLTFTDALNYLKKNYL